MQQSTVQGIYSRGCDITYIMGFHCCYTGLEGYLEVLKEMVIEGNWHATKTHVSTRLSVRLVWIWTGCVVIMHTSDNSLFTFFWWNGVMKQWEVTLQQCFVFPRPRLLLVQVGTTTIESIHKSQFRHHFSWSNTSSVLSMFVVLRETLMFDTPMTYICQIGSDASFHGSVRGREKEEN